MAIKVDFKMAAAAILDLADAKCHGKSSFRLLSVRLSVRLFVTFVYRDHIGWNTSKIISRPNSLRLLLGLTPNMGDLV